MTRRLGEHAGSQAEASAIVCGLLGGADGERSAEVVGRAGGWLLGGDGVDVVAFPASGDRGVTGFLVQGVVAAINRKMDDEAIRAFFAARNMGESGTSVDNFNTSTNQVGVSVGGTTSGLNVEKLQNAIQIFEENEIDLDMEQIYCVISPKQKRNLMNEIEVTSGDFFKGQVMSTRNVNGFLSINFIVSNRLLTDSSSYRRVPIFTPKGMTFASWGGLQTTVSQRHDLRGHPWQVYGQGHFGAVRRDAKRVIEIQCSEA